MAGIDKIIRFEDGEMDFAETIAFFQQMIDTGVVWQLQGRNRKAGGVCIIYG